VKLDAQPGPAAPTETPPAVIRPPTPPPSAPPPPPTDPSVAVQSPVLPGAAPKTDDAPPSASTPIVRAGSRSLVSPAVEQKSAQAPAREQQDPASAVPHEVPIRTSSAGTRVVIHYRDGSSAEWVATRMAALASPLATTVQTRLVGGTPSRAEIRFFYSVDETKARRLADTLRALAPGLEVRNFSAFRPSPSPGTIEVWVPKV
jgi:hypothetical protein